MALPFTHEQFLDVFGAYNTALWPAALLLWLVTAWAVATWLRRGERGSRLLAAVLAVHWAWSAIAYHAAFFRQINPAASIFAALFLVQAALFLGFGFFRDAWRWRFEPSPRGFIGLAFVAYGLLYPAVGLASGLDFPRMPAFAVPCPTTLVTAGVLLLSVPAPSRLANFIPLVWTAVGGSGAFLLGIRADLALIAAGALLLVDSVAPSALGRRNVVFSVRATTTNPRAQ